MIDGRNISFTYGTERKKALDNVRIVQKEGEWLAIIGCNGSGKSTLARHLNRLLELQEGELCVAGIDVRDESQLWALRKLCGMVFQDPDNQFVAPVLEDDIAFGLENYNYPEEEIVKRTEEVLREVGLEKCAKRYVHTLSGGQKQRAALAGVLAYSPDILVFDEATAMLDPKGRIEMLEQLECQKKAGKTIVMITHYIDEAVRADRILLMKEARVLACGTPRQILTDERLLLAAGMKPPVPVQLYMRLKERGICLKNIPLTQKELVDELCQLDLKMCHTATEPQSVK